MFFGELSILISLDLRQHPDYAILASDRLYSTGQISFQVLKLKRITDVTGGHVSAAASPMPGAFPYVSAGKLRALAVTSASTVSKLVTAHGLQH